MEDEQCGWCVLATSHQSFKYWQVAADIFIVVILAFCRFYCLLHAYFFMTRWCALYWQSSVMHTAHRQVFDGSVVSVLHEQLYLLTSKSHL